MVQASNELTEKRLKWSCEENESGAHGEKNARCDIPVKRIRDRLNIRWGNACKRDMPETGLQEDNT